MGIFYDITYLSKGINMRFYYYLYLVPVAIISAVVSWSYPYTYLPVDAKEHDV